MQMMSNIFFHENIRTRYYNSAASIEEEMWWVRTFQGSPNRCRDLAPSYALLWGRRCLRRGGDEVNWGEVWSVASQGKKFGGGPKSHWNQTNTVHTTSVHNKAKLFTICHTHAPNQYIEMLCQDQYVHINFIKLTTRRFRSCSGLGWSNGAPALLPPCQTSSAQV